MKLARASVLGLALIATTTLGSPAFAAAEAPQDTTKSSVITLESVTNYGGFASFHKDYTVRAAQVLLHDYSFTDTPSLDKDEYFRGKLTPSQVKRLRSLISSPKLAAEQGIKFRIECDNGPVTFWKLTAGDLTVEAPSCEGAPPVLPTLAEVAGVITSVRFEG